jgi:radical SAM superfamily enzyme YgiQ (UPF0313 family)
LRDDIILTADSTLMSDYHKNEFAGFGTCAPPNFIPDALYRFLFFPPIKVERGIPAAAPYGLRKIEAQLQNEGFRVKTLAPDHLGKYVAKAKVLGIHVMDPFGLGPASSTFAFVLRKEPFLARYFHALLAQPEVRRAKKNGLKIIVGGPGVWQFQHRQRFVEKYGIDCIISGEAEKVVGKIFKAAIEDQPLPKYYETSVDESPKLEEIPDIVNPSINGLVEIGRGCCRGCQFCSVTLRPLRWFPIEKISREIDLNHKLGGIDGAVLHAEDVMLYGSKNTLPNSEKLIKLHEVVVEACEGISWSHCSLAAVASQPDLFAKVAEIVKQKQPWWGVEIGIETGSPKLVSKIMYGKAHPFKPEQWPDIVRTGMGLMHDNNLVPAGTLIVGSPEETDDDLMRTMELMDDLKGIRSLIVPLFFVPLGRLKDEHWFKGTQMTEIHRELLTKCMEHDFYWIHELINMSLDQRWQAKVLAPFYRMFSSIVKYKARQSGINLTIKD